MANGERDDRGAGRGADPTGEPATDGSAPDSRYPHHLGARLRIVREQRGRSLLAVQALSGGEFKASVLGAYERGERTVSVARLQRLATLYDVPVDQLLPPGDGPPTGLAVGAPRLHDGQRGSRVADGSSGGRARVPVDLEQLRGAHGAEVEALRHFLASVQVERQDFNGRVLTIRRDDVRLIGAVLGLGFGETLRRLEELGILFPSDRARAHRDR